MLPIDKKKKDLKSRTKESTMTANNRHRRERERLFQNAVIKSINKRAMGMQTEHKHVSNEETLPCWTCGYYRLLASDSKKK